MANDTWRTPPEVIGFITEKFGSIKIDLCSDDKNKICDLNLTQENNFLNNYWIDKNLINKGDLAWCNPPYSNPLPFVKQCIKWAKHGYAVAGILNLDSSPKWFVELVNAKALIMQIIGGRIYFLNEMGDPIKKNNKPQLMFYLAPFLAQSVQTEYIKKSDIYQQTQKSRN